MQEFQNTRDVHLMVWETNKRIRGKGNHQTNVNVPKGVVFNVGDRIFMGNKFQSSFWTIQDIKSKRQSSLQNMEYYHTTANYTHVQPK